MKVSVASLLLVACFVGAVQADELSCRSERRFGQEGALQVRAKLRRSGSSVTGLVMESATVVYATKTGYSCSAALDLKSAHATWTTTGATTTVTVAADEAGESSTVSIRRTGKGFLISPQGLSTESCGTRGQWPASVLVPLRGARCKTTY